MDSKRLSDGQAIRPGYWFRPKSFGIGATPVTWQGWLFTLAIGVCAALIGNFAAHGHLPFVALLVPLLIVSFWITILKTDGGWQWRWGRDR